ncbi:MAG: hypothetical protein MI924_29845 [Chloroflexales bacterium]|nr:hypothetical protein [Chloroflexales bacterium]
MHPVLHPALALVALFLLLPALAHPSRATLIGRCQSPKALAKRLRYRGFRGYPPKFPGKYCRIRLDIGTLVLQMRCSDESVRWVQPSF